MPPSVRRVGDQAQGCYRTQRPRTLPTTGPLHLTHMPMSEFGPRSWYRSIRHGRRLREHDQPWFQENAEACVLRMLNPVLKVIVALSTRALDAANRRAREKDARWTL